MFPSLANLSCSINHNPLSYINFNRAFRKPPNNSTNGFCALAKASHSAISSAARPYKAIPLKPNKDIDFMEC